MMFMEHLKLLELRGFLSFLILHELSVASVNGEKLARLIGKRRGKKLTPGTIYPALKKLRALKLVSYRRSGRDKVYFLTEKGKVELMSLYKDFSRYFYGLKKNIKRKY